MIYTSIREMKTMIFVLAVVTASTLVLLIVLSCTTRPPQASLVNGKLRACPDTPNCVSSESDEASSRVKPLVFKGPSQAAWQKLKETIQDLGGKIQAEQAGYLRAAFTTAVLRFVDDMEFRMDASNNIIHVRSASRVGYSDLGVNRRRVAKLRAAFNEKTGQKTIAQ